MQNKAYKFAPGHGSDRTTDRSSQQHVRLNTTCCGLEVVWTTSREGLLWSTFSREVESVDLGHGAPCTMNQNECLFVSPVVVWLGVCCLLSRWASVMPTAQWVAFQDDSHLKFRHGSGSTGI